MPQLVQNLADALKNHGVDIEFYDMNAIQRAVRQLSTEDLSRSDYGRMDHILLGEGVRMHLTTVERVLDTVNCMNTADEDFDYCYCDRS